MITELAILNVRENQSGEFENSFDQAQKIISKMNGYLGHELQKCVEEENKYVLIVRWEKLKDHTEGFRKSEEYKRWKDLLHHYYSPFPTVEHYVKIF
ncbi:MAG TPA: antibiotic biosynthesis monooxygenase [Puia sp.]|nr:antibiotic biosynthesis monooxygenase [Puia sp.]